MNENSMKVILSYKFGNKHFVELARTSYQEGTPKHKRLSCLWIDYDNDEITKLNFVSLKDENGVITREFKEATLIVATKRAEMTFENEKYTTSL